MKISVIILSFNRPLFLCVLLSSLRAQEYPNLDIIVIDNGSSKNLFDSIGSTFSDLDLQFIRLERNQRPDPYITGAFLACKGEVVFPYVSDDDFFEPDSLRRVAEVYERTNADIVASSFRRLDFSGGAFRFKEKSFKENLLKLPAGPNLVNQYCASWGIGSPKPNVPIPSESHASSTSMRREVLMKTIASQGALMIGPLGDVGFLGALYHCEHYFYLDLPLHIISEGHGQMMDFARKKGRRRIPHCSRTDIKFSPLKGLTFSNLGIESHLTVLIKNKKFDPKIHFFNTWCLFRYFDELLSRDVDNETREDLIQYFEVLSRFNLKDNSESVLKVIERSKSLLKARFGVSDSAAIVVDLDVGSDNIQGLDETTKQGGELTNTQLQALSRHLKSTISIPNGL